MGIDSRAIKYHYKSRKFSRNLVLHVFRYFSAVSGLDFVQDDSEPDIFMDEDHKAPPSAKVVISAGVASVVGARRTDGRKNAIAYDPVDMTARRLTISGVRGPLSKVTHSQAASGPLSSVSIGDFVGLLCESGLIARERRPISLWPGKSRFGVAVTHDIDILRRSIPGSVRLLFDRQLPGGWMGLFDSIRSATGLAPNPYDGVAKWIRLEREMGFESTYFIFSGRRRHKFDPVYNSDMLEKAVGEIGKGGFDIGLHTSVGSFAGEGIAEAKAQLERASGISVAGLRPHYLSASFPEYWRAALDAGIEYSSSLGFDDEIGFFDGMDLPFIPFDPRSDSAVDIVEFPIAIMDCGLIGDGRANSDDVVKRGREIIDNAKSSGSLIVMDWHQRTFYNRDYPGWVELFANLAKYSKESGGCFMGLREFAKIFRERFWRKM